MKVKLQLDLASIKNWLFEHGEKVAFAIVGVVFLLFTYSAFSREMLASSKQPTELKKLADGVRDHVASSKFDRAREGVQVVDYAERAMSKPVKPDHYVLATPLNRPILDPKAKRGEPEVLGVEDLRVAANFDVFAFNPNGAGEPAGGPAQHARLQPQPWAVVTGVVPIEKQRQEYARVFAQAVGGNESRDTPRYLMPILERTEVDAAHPEKENWQRVDPATKFESQWASDAKEIVAEKYTDPELTGHLCQLFYNEWGEAVSHPKVLLASEVLARAIAPPAVAPETPAAEAAPPEAAPSGPVFNTRALKPGPVDPTKQPESPSPAVDEVPQYRLLRVFDYTVEPGKKYRYRVTIGLRNPNHTVPPLHLKNPQSSVSVQLAGKPSATTGVVTIPDGHRILAGSVDAGSRFNEPSGSVVVTAIDRKEGFQAATEIKGMRRGAVANKKDKVSVEDPQSHQVKELTLDFTSNILVLDIAGGRALPTRRRAQAITTPGEVLLLDAEGNMIVRNELDDQTLYAKSVVREKTVAPPPEKPDDDAKAGGPGNPKRTKAREKGTKLAPPAKRLLNSGG